MKWRQAGGASESHRGWPEVAPVAATVTLDLSGAGKADPTLSNISAGTRIDDFLFLAGDEGAAIERVARLSDDRWGDHARSSLAIC